MQCIITNESQEVSSFLAGDSKVAMNRWESMKTQDRKKQKRSTKEVPS